MREGSVSGEGRIQRGEGGTAIAFILRAYVSSELEGVAVGAENLGFIPPGALVREQRNYQNFLVETWKG